MRNHLKRIAVLVACAFGLYPVTASAGPIFLTGHDPDFHAQGDFGAQNLLNAGLSFVTGGTHKLDDGNKFLWVESRIPTPGGHLIGENGLGTIGLSLGTHYDRANGFEFASVDLSDYTAIAIASSFGGLLTRSELDALIARSADIETFINNGGGLFASAECFPCGANLLDGATAPDLFGYLPVDVTSIGASSPFHVTSFGAAAPFNLTDADLNSATHNSFGETGGLNIVDTDSAQHATTLAGNVQVQNGGFTPTQTPEPGTMALFAAGLLGLGIFSQRRFAVSGCRA